jgi:hypothetical protein
MYRVFLDALANGRGDRIGLGAQLDGVLVVDAVSLRGNLVCLSELALDIGQSLAESVVRHGE